MEKSKEKIWVNCEYRDKEETKPKEIGTMKTLKEQIAVMQAFENKKKIEYIDLLLTNHIHEWLPAPDPTWNWEKYDFRVKEEPKAEDINWEPWEKYKPTNNDNVLPIKEPPCKSCKFFLPHRKYFQDGTYNGVTICGKDYMCHDFSCYSSK